MFDHYTTFVLQATPFIVKLLKFTEDILAAGHMGCIVRLAETIARLEMVEKQKTFLNVICQALHIPNDGVMGEPLAKLILSMMTYDVFFKISDEEIAKESETDRKTQELTKSAINYHGACLLKSCFAFKKSKLIVNSFLTLSVNELVDTAFHHNANFAFESFFQNQSIPVKRKKELSEKLLGSLYILACDKFGSRVVDSIWISADDEMRVIIQSELRRHKSKLESDLYGRIVLYNCGLKQQVEKMREITEKKEKKRKLFEDILQTKEVIPPVAKKDKKSKDGQFFCIVSDNLFMLLLYMHTRKKGNMHKG